ncbi:hypothetical protein PFICI_02001 [Pestalotiopsis fici W106-1]|uniref:Major facilitator superfamily (MFS) profile domain-containing protein n=1 Tax=Pestalotiopsis fici (strain W106-1 / CGMCC3.15140) TaxID=1229662 RepID=W3XQ46_PESFW|nr:uncharacterized protein PFICI_02001 [Pestalotiopsis fici W106-1]ETS88173.1 hypothetical protein PFICI_02001 [Pestalotiopsis fici W106-1]
METIHSEKNERLVDEVDNEAGEIIGIHQDTKVIRRKLDFYLLPLLISGFFVLQLDRSNISNALTDTITEDLGITTDDVNLGNQLMSAGIAIAEIPSNIILQRFGASKWLTFQMLVWGTVAICQAWVTNIHSFYATRFLLGLFEGGYIPGAMYMLALFYTKSELAVKTSVFYFGNYVAAAVGPLVAAGILQMAGLGGLSGWQWLFIIEGGITLLIFLVFVLFLPRSPAHTRPIHGLWDFFSEDERKLLRARIVADDEYNEADKVSMSFRDVKDSIVDYRLWLHMLLNIVTLTPKGGLQLYGPLVIKTLGFSKVNANLLSAVSSVLVLIFSYCISIVSDRTRWRGPFCILAFAWSIIFAGSVLGVSKDASASKWTLYAVFTLLSGGNAVSQSLNDAWVSINARSPSRRSLGLAMVVMGSNFGGIIGPQLFRSSDAPKYPHAFLAILVLYAAAIPITLLMMWVYSRDNKEAQTPGTTHDGTLETRRRYDL